MGYAAQRDAIATIMATIPDIGRIHTRPRYGDAYEHWVTTLNGIDQIRAWEIGLADPGIEPRRIQQNHRHKYSTFRIQGYISLADVDATYDTVIELAEAIGNALDADQRLGNTMLDHEPAVIGEPVVLTIGGGALCWGITLTMTGYEVTQP